jgi:two-component system response regulator AdeR
MSGATTIVLAREDLSIPGGGPFPADADAVQQRFFALVSASNPDVIVLDFSKAPRSGATTIVNIRRHSAAPILIVCDPAHPLAKAYRSAGASECISAPVDPLCLSQAVRRVLRITGNSRAGAMRGPTNFSFAGMSFQSERKLLVADDGSTLALTNSEGRLLAHFLLRPWTVCSRAEIRKLLYGRDDAAGRRALDAVVNRLRKKLSSLVRSSAPSLIQTQIRCGYWLAADVMTLPQRASAQPW